MVNEKKVRLMTKAAMIEEKNERSLFLSKKFYLGDYTLFHTVKAVVGMTVAYVILVAFLFIDNSEALTTEYTVDGLLNYMRAYLFIYVGLLVVTVVISVFSCTERFWKSKKIMQNYYNTLKKINKGYK